MKRQKDRTLKDERPKLVGAQYATDDQRKNNIRRVVRNRGLTIQSFGDYNEKLEFHFKSDKKPFMGFHIAEVKNS